MACMAVAFRGRPMASRAFRQERLPVTVFLMNGFQMRGTVTGYDPFVVVLESDGRQQVIYKHAISTVVPLRPVALRESEEEAAL